MANFGNLSLALAFSFSIYSTIALFFGTQSGRREVVKSGYNALYAVLFFATCATVALIVLLARSDFNIEYVANYTNRDLPMFYKLAAFWGGQKGSLLLWTWLLALFSAIIAYRQRHLRGDFINYALGIMMLTSIFFLLLNKFVANPFDTLGIQHQEGLSAVPFTPRDGRGLNPLLQHPEMVIHPPVLYVGFVGFVVPFAFAMAALMTKEMGNAWLKITRRWSLASWFFLGAGILLGANWAYVELGWGGYWAWDPVENASLMPWLTGTAFLHSVIVQERRNMLKVWNVSLISATYLLCIFGTFITRSGIVSSVHAFAKSSIGYYFLVFLGLMAIGSAYLILTRLKYLKSENELDTLVSRESSFLFNNIVLLAACFAVLWGTMFPTLSEAIRGEQITIGPPFFNKINIPIGLFLLFLTGIAPLLAWRKTSGRSLRKNFLPPVAAGIIAAVALIIAGVRSVYPVMSFALCAFVLVTIVSEFYRGTAARIRATGEQFIEAFTNLILRNKRRYGGYVVHLGVVMMFAGFTGSAFNTETHAEIREGEQFTIKDYTLVCRKVEEGENPNFAYLRATLDVIKNGKQAYSLHPEKRYYFASEQATSEVAIKSTLKEDLYVVFSGMDENGGPAVIQAYVNPLVVWIWIGGFTLAFGTLLTVLPDAREVRFNRRKRELERMLEASEKI
ncbi:MAG: heme lyase CcmF/NrfE family subunit [Candidatus Latescibacteria bacterium]|nr:heme lyase CcmF/NrfE family subunit [Candidatus Latescibacterota bacterium]NIM22400.1 heme lyase CcmF/NrfE family subunit [Candidatus Latescibacterota bacterium]NIM64760.1 heme lyase CcmF/NrfE family subunit [Candidatus Latescibacterota bacterium]NIO01271.1 heme lyase CcmF/NrfE family subunit [Candidatus Latescibacterota bacterium]NIO27763.1 heme lyase CcmF/NrfE family subunit [Candidatus Latescibacterota bacterium]